MEMESSSSSREASPDVSEDSGEETVPVFVTYNAPASDSDAFVFNWRRLLMFAGPGLLMSIAYVDPGNLESDLQTGFQAGYKLGWLILWSTILGFVVQLLAVRLGVVTGKHLAQQCRVVYPPVPRVALWIMIELAIIGSDIQEVIGSAIAIQLLSGGRIPLWVGVLVTALDTFFLLYLERLGVRKLEAFFGALVGVMTISFGVMYFKADAPTAEVLAGVAIPRLQWSQLTTAVGIVGALVMPHNIFLHSALVQSRKIDLRHNSAKREAVTYNAIESAVSLSITVFINIFVMSVFAKGFHGQEGIADVGLSTAGEYLGDKFGDAMKYIWALGLLAAGQSSTMTGTYTGQFVMSGFLDMHVSAWLRAAITRSVALVPTLIVALVYAGTTEMDALNQALNVVQSLQLPFALIPVLYITSREDIMGPAFVVQSTFRTIVYIISGALLAVNATLVASVALTAMTSSVIGGVATFTFTCTYVAFVTYLMLGPRLAYRLLARSPLRVCRWLADRLGSDGVAEPAGAEYAPVCADRLPELDPNGLRDDTLDVQ